MATVIGYDEKLYKKFTCRKCAAIVQYTENEERPSGGTDEGTLILGLTCPNCGNFHRTNP
jgi:RNase P subunit RPR2